MNGDTQIYDPVQPAQQETPTQPVQDDYDIHVKTMDVGQYNTINLQAELAAGLREVLGEEPKGDTAKATSDSITRSIVAPMMDSDTESLDYPEIAEVSEDDLEPETEQIEGSEVFFGETGEIGDLSQVPEVETEEILAGGTPHLLRNRMLCRNYRKQKWSRKRLHRWNLPRSWRMYWHRNRRTDQPGNARGGKH